MLYKNAERRHRAYIKGVTSGKTKQQAAIDAGFSESTARVPQVLEKKWTHHKVMKSLAEDAGNMQATLYHDLKLRIAKGELDEMDAKSFLWSINQVGNFLEKIIPKEKRESKPIFNIYNIEKQKDAERIDMSETSQNEQGEEKPTE